MPPKRAKRPSRETPSAISATLREVILGRGLTPYALAQSAGVAPSVVSRFLRRERGLTLETFDAIAGALGLRLVETGRPRAKFARESTPSRQSTLAARPVEESACDNLPSQDTP